MRIKSICCKVLSGGCYLKRKENKPLLQTMILSLVMMNVLQELKEQSELYESKRWNMLL